VRIRKFNDREKKYDKEDNLCVDVSEMFAVATEKYFEDTKRLNSIAPEIYQQMNIVYKQNILIEKSSLSHFQRALDYLGQLSKSLKKLKTKIRL